MTKFNKKKAYRRGVVAEYLAIFMLLLKGYKIVALRYKTPVGEIDVIAKRRNITIFCEVKARNDYETAANSLSAKQKGRIRRAAEYYMAHLKNKIANNKIENEIYRCDMIAVMPWKWPVHIEDAW